MPALPLPGGAMDDDPVPATPCETYPRATCIASLDCTLSKGDEPDEYRCEAANGPCEEGLAQDDVDACRARPMCAYREEMCYCACRGSGRAAVMDGEEAEECLCACAGGGPPRCFEEAVDFVD